ncbi:ATP-binding cassette domain-containing protein, partial [Bacillus sp. SIMBA_005]|uniref:ATP-binding cassette domain-containing protein n=1 Tax=Bacillus sp. SIMBA_005 TaxID=3085754 RepID=UPI0039780974
LDSVSFSVTKGECLAVVGESGSGKSTIANIILGIYAATTGNLTFKGEALPARRTQEHRRAIQLVQQNPLSSLNPRRSIGASLRLALN